MSLKLARIMPVFIPISLLSHILLIDVSTVQHNFIYPIQVYGKITVDVYGAILPVTLSILFVIIYFAHFKGSYLSIIECFLFAFALSAFTFNFAFSDGELQLQSYPANLGFLVGLVSTLIFFFNDDALRTKTLMNYIRSHLARNYVTALLAAFGVSTTSALLVDLSFAPFFDQESALTSINIGGGGLTDGILFFGLFAIVWTTFFTSALVLFVEIMRTSQEKGEESKS